MKIKTMICLLLACLLVLQLGGCAAAKPGVAGPGTEPAPEPGTGPAPEPVNGPAELKAVNLMADVTRNPGTAAPVDAASAEAAADFALRLFRAAHEKGENALISPLSVLCALAMTANGADGETLAQMEQTLGMDRDALNAFFRSYLSALSSDEGGTLRLANSVWFTDRNGFEVNRDFLQRVADVYDADAYLAPFDDTTLADINNWVRQNTDGMIPEILDRIPEDAVMYLINALAFDAKWMSPYHDYDVREGEFTAQNGEKRTVEFMHSEENIYLEDDGAVGFVKLYEDGKYAFAALLPKEGVTVEDYLSTLDAGKLLKMFREPTYDTVFASLPKFETACDAELSDVLKGMGMEIPFDGSRADLHGLGSCGDNNLYISRVLHKTFISVAEDGTRAGAATAVEVGAEGCIEDPKTVDLDRPFIYMLVDCETGLPFFIGTMLDPEG